MGAFARWGFRGTRSRELAEAAGVSEALIFRQFPKKRAIQTAIIEEQIRQTAPIISIERREAPLDRALEASERDPSFLRLPYFAGLESEPLAPIFFKRRVSRSIEELADLYRLWVRRGWVRKAIDARIFAWSLRGCVVQLVVARSIFSVKRMSDHRGSLAAKVTALFLQGIRS